MGTPECLDQSLYCQMESQRIQSESRHSDLFRCFSSGLFVCLALRNVAWSTHCIGFASLPSYCTADLQESAMDLGEVVLYYE